MSTAARILGSNIERFRKDRKWSRQAMADRAGLDYSLVSRYVAGRTSPTLETIEKIARVFDIEVTDLLRDPDADPSPEELARCCRYVIKFRRTHTD